MSDANLGKTIEKIIGKIRKRKAENVEDNVRAEETSKVSIPEKIYIKALLIRSLEDIDIVKSEVKSGNIMIIRVGPLAEKNLEDVKRAVSELCEFTELIGGDIARLGEERVVVTPPFVKIWREKTATLEGETPTAS